jgi:hypothetical protein
MMAQFSRLFEALRKSGRAEIEQHVGRLPASAHKYQAYWSNLNPRMGDIGYKIKRVRLGDKGALRNNLNKLFV